MALHLTHDTQDDRIVIEQQLGRVPRSIAGIAARCVCGKPLVVATKPRLDDGTPFPTTFYLTHPYLTVCVSRLEAVGLMKEITEELQHDEELAQQYKQAHKNYLQMRDEIGQEFEIDTVQEIKDFSAGGMPTRVKCLHALVGHSLAVGPGINPIGDRALKLIAEEKENNSWNKDQCFCEEVVLHD